MQLRDERNPLTGGASEKIVSIFPPGPPGVPDNLPAVWLATQNNIADDGPMVLGGSTIVVAEATRRGILLRTTGSKENRPLIVLHQLNLKDVHVGLEAADTQTAQFAYLEP